MLDEDKKSAPGAAVQGIALRAIVLLPIAVILGGASAIKPDALDVPREITCLELPEPLSFTGHYGMFKVDWITKLDKGAYVSERIDSKGTYYRAPAGGVSITRGPGGPAGGVPGMPARTDGGVFIPDDANEPVRIYRYFSTAEAPTDTSGVAATCSSLGYTKNPSGKETIVIPIASVSGTKMSFGQTVGVSVAGGLIAGGIVSAIINSEVGKIVPGLPIQDAQFMGKLRELATNRVILKEIQPVPGASPATNTESASGK
ncbi:MAG TPA: hypothetical protein VF848_04295 [Steroidobacteraceae bacterium]